MKQPQAFRMLKAIVGPCSRKQSWHASVSTMPKFLAFVRGFFVCWQFTAALYISHTCEPFVGCEPCLSRTMCLNFNISWSINQVIAIAFARIASSPPRVFSTRVKPAGNAEIPKKWEVPTCQSVTGSDIPNKANYFAKKVPTIAPLLDSLPCDPKKRITGNRIDWTPSKVFFCEDRQCFVFNYEATQTRRIAEDFVKRKYSKVRRESC